MDKTNDTKRTEFIHCRMTKELADKVEQFCKDTNLTRTAMVERALNKYIDFFRETGKI